VQNNSAESYLPNINFLFRNIMQQLWFLLKYLLITLLVNRSSKGVHKELPRSLIGIDREEIRYKFSIRSV